MGASRSAQAAHVRTAHHGELRKVNRFGLGIGARVNQQREPLHGGHHRGDRGPVDAGQIAQQRDADHHHGAGVAGAYDGIDLAALEQLIADVQRGLRFGEHRFKRRVVHGDDFRRVLDGQVRPSQSCSAISFCRIDRSPTRTTRSLSSRAASTAPSTVACGAKSPPIASSAILTAHPAGLFLDLRQLASAVGAAMARIRDAAARAHRIAGMRSG